MYIYIILAHQEALMCNTCQMVHYENVMENHTISQYDRPYFDLYDRQNSTYVRKNGLSILLNYDSFIVWDHIHF